MKREKRKIGSLGRQIGSLGRQNGNQRPINDELYGWTITDMRRKCILCKICTVAYGFKKSCDL